MKLHSDLFLVGTLLLFLSCHKNKQEPIDYGYGYFPKTLGHFIIYEVDSIIYNDFAQTIDTTHCEIKEILTENFNDISGRPSQRIEKYVRFNDTASWIISEVGYQTVTTYVAEKYEDNLRYIKLSFPVKNGLNWKGNTYINYIDNTNCDWLANNWDYKLSNVDDAIIINGNHFEKSARVLAVDEDLIICKNHFEEIYARNVGMIYRKAERLNIDSIYPSGYSLEYKIKTYN